jgi:methylenetetrahydrofolate--tRNA-(uracil-5-)-methyltransferase
MHRNTFIFSPGVLNECFQLISNKRIYFCGQITGIEGYLSNIASGFSTGINLAKHIKGQSAILFPETTMTGALFSFATRADNENFQPMKPNFGLLPPLEKPVRSNEDRFEAYVLRAQADMDAFLNENEKNI